jgi:transketolase
MSRKYWILQIQSQFYLTRFPKCSIRRSNTEGSHMYKQNKYLKDWFAARPEYCFKSKTLSELTKARLRELSLVARGDILTMTTVASSGHPGGPLSSADIYTIVYSLARTHPETIANALRDRIVISHGHTSAGCYALLGRLGFFDIEDALANFRRCGSIFEGHVEREVPGCEWTTGNLGQGLSAGCGFALASRIQKEGYHVFVLMSDAEQAKGQVAEARRFAKHHGLANITCVIDYNEIQISGSVHDIMQVNIKKNYESDGWNVLEINGHSYTELYDAIRTSLEDTTAPFAILCHTVIGKGVSFMEKAREYYHGRPLKPEEYDRAMKELTLENRLADFKAQREKTLPQPPQSCEFQRKLRIETGKPRTYGIDQKLGNRDAFGKALEDIAKLNRGRSDQSPVIALDCDLKESVRTHLFEQIAPEWFFEGGVQEHNTVTIAGVASVEGILTFFADFGVFGIDEVYNQQRLNAINHTNLKTVITHSGINVGQDGKTHHCIDFIGLARNLPGVKVIVPADPNQTDRALRYLARTKGNFLMVTGRGTSQVIPDTEGNPFFGGNYGYEYGAIDEVRDGDRGVILTYGISLFEALQAWEELNKEGISFALWNVSAPLAIQKEDIEKAIFKGPVITFEDHLIHTGLGSIVGELIAHSGMGTTFHKIGVTGFAPSGSTKELYCTMGIDASALKKEVRRIVNAK